MAKTGPRNGGESEVRFRIPEIVLGALLMAAAFGVWSLFSPIAYPWEWLTRDASGFFTASLFVIGGLQLWLFYYQLKLIRQSLEPAQQAAKAAADATKNAEEAFAKLQRPYVYIFGVHKLEYDDADPVADVPHVKYSVANYGKTPAAIRIIVAGIGTHPEQPLDPLQQDYRDDPSHDLLARPVLAPNDVRSGIRVHAPDGIDFVHSHGEVIPKLTGGDQLFVWIMLNYRGPFGEAYVASACWRYDGLTNRLVRWGGDVYNYVS